MTEEEVGGELEAYEGYSGQADQGGRVRVRRGAAAHEHQRHAAGERRAHLSDGPFAETKEQLGGFYVLDCKDLDEALAWAERCPAAAGAGRSRSGR